jgi:predicted protein tyrosine phosphatase
MAVTATDMFSRHPPIAEDEAGIAVQAETPSAQNTESIATASLTRDLKTRIGS